MNNYDNYTNTNSGSSKEGWALGFGLLAGIALGYYLNSNEGRAARRKAKVRFDEYGQQVYNQARERSGQLVDKAKTQIEQGKQWANETATNVKSTVTSKAEELKNTASSSANTVKSSFQKGMDKAKANLNNKADKIDDVVNA